MTELEIKLQELRLLRDSYLTNKDANRNELILVRENIRNVQDCISAEKREKAKPRKLSLYDSKNADKVWEQALGQGAFN